MPKRPFQNAARASQACAVVIERAERNDLLNKESKETEYMNKAAKIEKCKMAKEQAFKTVNGKRLQKNKEKKNKQDEEHKRQMEERQKELETVENMMQRREENRRRLIFVKITESMRRVRAEMRRPSMREKRS